MDIFSNFLIYLLSFLAVLTGIVFVHEWGHFIVARLNKVRVDVFSIGFGRALLSWKDKSGTVWKISLIPVGGYVKFFGDETAASTPIPELSGLSASERAVSFHHKSVAQRAAIVAAGPMANFIFSIIIYTTLFIFYGQPYTAPVVGDVLPQSAAEQAGIAAGDRILSVNGTEIVRFEQIRSIVALAADDVLVVHVLRDNQNIQLEVTPRRVQVDDGFGGKARVGQIGIRAAGTVEVRKLAPDEAVIQSFGEIYSIISTTITYLGRFVTGRESGEELGGPLRIAKMSGDVAQISLLALISLAAALSVSIGFINLFPIPLLDGGHLMFYVFEALRGKPLSERIMNYGFRVGMAFMVGLFIFSTWNDLVHLRVVAFIKGLFS